MPLKHESIAHYVWVPTSPSGAVPGVHGSYTDPCDIFTYTMCISQAS